MDEVEYLPKDFADEQYARKYASPFNKYAELRVLGKTREMAMLEAFEIIKHGMGTDNIGRLGLAAEMNPYVQERMAHHLSKKDVRKELWSEKKAVRKLLELIEDESVRDSTRLNAITALNVLCGYVQMDEAMSKRVGHTLADFAKLSADSEPAVEGEESNTHSLH
jgi:hypothetical protein